MDSAFVLANRDGLRRAGGADDFAHRADPIREFFLSEKSVVVNTQRIHANVHAAPVKFVLGRKRNGAGDGVRRKIPRGGERGAVWIFLREPGVPGGQLDGIVVGAHLPEMLGEARLVDKVPS